MTVFVVKLGGSLLGSAHLDRWLEALCDTPVPLAVVPGGGPFADAVREAQPKLDFGDKAAHRMAILAMEQTAELLRERAPQLWPCASDADFRRASRERAPALWMPAVLAREASDMPAGWDVTSDSLAAWLAIHLGAQRLILLKSARIDPPDGPVERWVAAGLVDAHLPRMLERFNGDLAVLDAGAPESASEFRRRLDASRHVRLGSC